jgi:hypothetical protein
MIVRTKRNYWFERSISLNLLVDWLLAYRVNLDIRNPLILIIRICLLGGRGAWEWFPLPLLPYCCLCVTL